MRRILILTTVAMLAASGALAADGKAIFQENGCSACHAPDATLVGPSLKVIAQQYAGKEDRLLKFFKGEEDPLVNPGQFAMMKPNLETTKALSDADRKALADYILANK